MTPVEGTLEGLCEFAEALCVEEDEHSYECPICGVDNDEWSDCGCFADLHYGGH